MIHRIDSPDPISNMELLAPEGSPELAQYRNGIVADYIGIFSLIFFVRYVDRSA